MLDEEKSTTRQRMMIRRIEKKERERESNWYDVNLLEPQGILGKGLLLDKVDITALFLIAFPPHLPFSFAAPTGNRRSDKG